MTEEVENLILEQLRLMRAEIGATREDIKDLAGRVDTMETELRGLSCIVTVSIGSILSEVKDLKRRVGALENA